MRNNLKLLVILGVQLAVMPALADVPLLAAKSSRALSSDILPSWVVDPQYRSAQPSKASPRETAQRSAPVVELANPRDELFKGPRHLPTREATAKRQQSR